MNSAQNSGLRQIANQFEAESVLMRKSFQSLVSSNEGTEGAIKIEKEPCGFLFYFQFGAQDWT
ncbi:MAG: hypothetical protein COW01_08540 [Bdellovibrionales bacterium CG12_big_fil_rev_8_21_14_0_65_38_15]|nr:MAG: hypothetical protein COW79_01525 [Bdellovibrionales bacterium CG22_combo_CG10-13_8_21_14_all_38_13]PIQ55049.1 MAG: hypothetical protein COW01_08540 [Bdellovibrionales bacterium CG12_big_fil_rev_8_21_14_0_65_38_15]PIR30530.1 MAG: hypothetical protein COV38_05115 [Bdellovibrionales bacterium CG11_big_fil_rev_8_21_14_0_20_38_13]